MGGGGGSRRRKDCGEDVRSARRRDGRRTKNRKEVGDIGRRVSDVVALRERRHEGAGESYCRLYLTAPYFSDYALCR